MGNISAWSHTEAGTRNSTRVVRQMARVKVPCPRCGRPISSNAVGLHLRACNGGQVEQPRPRRNEPGHTRCACGRKMAIDAARCFRCAGGEEDLIAAMGVERARRAKAESIYESRRIFLESLRRPS
jgi:hypothetical protein